VRRQYRFGEYELDLENASLKRRGEEISLSGMAA
jgi:DNA-binding winged helix-turn-helix (wHTH) protein